MRASIFRQNCQVRKCGAGSLSDATEPAFEPNSPPLRQTYEIVAGLNAAHACPRARRSDLRPGLVRTDSADRGLGCWYRLAALGGSPPCPQVGTPSANMLHIDRRSVCSRLKVWAARAPAHARSRWPS